MLTEDNIAALSARARAYKVYDSHGLYLFVTPRGAKSWRQKYRLGGKEQRIVFGLHPVISLSEARAMSLEVRRLRAAGIDPKTGNRPILAPCALDRFDETISSYEGADSVYFIRASTGQIKIGVANDVRQRLNNLQSANPLPLTLIGTVRGGFGVETLLHRAFADCRTAGEWFEPNSRMLDFIAAKVEPWR